MDNFIKHINKFTTISQPEIETLKSATKTISIKKKDLLLKEGEICRANYFVEKGCLRLYFINEKGSEQIIQFALENWWLTDYMSFNNSSPAQFYIQAVEDCTIIAIARNEQDKLLTEIPTLEKYFRKVLQIAYAASQNRLKFLYGYSKEESYLHFTNSFPAFVQRIPQYMLASYLGFTPEYLSELRKKLSQ
ncbi:Crp/Fnr family transcriptional regulator [Pedobacter arcticus]|uniref:Crp/Fnr family transcriptional regulator n=1 Tax=Pedobacter arcticus TaxID=752140 RepID=UPI000313D254|nr:Crp/Fnr family transcriptional regulator [Pedobacter arcticus]